MKKMTTLAFAMTLMASMPAMAEIGTDPALNLNPATTPSVQANTNADANLGTQTGAQAGAAGAQLGIQPTAQAEAQPQTTAPEAEAKTDSTNTKKLFHMFRDKPPVSEAKADAKTGVDVKADTDQKAPDGSAPETPKPEIKN